MTEFDFSPSTFQRDLAKPAQIANWFHPLLPAIHFRPTPGDHGSVDEVFPASRPFVPRHSVSERAEMEAAALLPPIPRRERLRSFPMSFSPPSSSRRPFSLSPQTTASRSLLHDSARYGQPYISGYSGRSWLNPCGPNARSRSPHKGLTSTPPSCIAPMLSVAANTGRGVPYVPQQAQLARPMVPRSMSEQSQVTIGPGRVGVPEPKTYSLKVLGDEAQQSQVTIEPGSVGIPSPYGYSLEVLGNEAPRIGHSLIPSVSLASFTLSEALSLNTHATLPTDRDPSVQLEGDQERLCI